MVSPTAGTGGAGLEPAVLGSLPGLIDDATTAVALLAGPEHVFVLANPAYRALVDDRPLIGRSVQEAFPELAEQGFYELLDGVYSTGEPFKGENIPVTLDRNGRLVEGFFTFTYQPMRGPDGEVDAIAVYAVETTQQVQAVRREEQAKQELQASEERLEEELDALAKLHRLSSRVWAAAHLDAALHEALDATIEMLGADFGNVQLYDASADALELVAQRGFGPEFVEAFRTVHRDTASVCAMALRTSQRVIVPDLESEPRLEGLRDIAARAGFRAVLSSPLTSSTGAMLGMLSAHFGEVRELTQRELQLLDLYARQAADRIERLQIEAALHSSHERLERVFLEAPAMIATMRGPEHVIELANRGYQRYVGARRELIGRTIRDVFPELEGQGFFELLDRVYATGEPFLATEMPYRMDRHGNGELVDGFVNFNLEPLRDLDGRVEGIFVLVVDVTDQVRGREEAEAAVRLRDEFISIASHELRTPLSAIKGMAQMGLQALSRPGADAGKLEQYLTVVLAGAERLNLLLDDLLDVSRMQRGGPAIRAEPVDLAALVTAIAARYRETVATDHRLLVALPDGDASIVADGGRLEQVLDNLLSNAVKYAPQGGDIHVSLKASSGGFALTVEDQGIGLPADQLERIFEPFGRARNALAAGLPGLGLGLHISRQIVQAHAGRMWAESAEGQGTSMHVWLPAGGAA